MMRGFLLLVLLINSEKAFSQSIADTPAVNPLSTVEVTYLRRTDFGYKSLDADSATLSSYKAANTATLLMQQFPVFVRSYGVNGLATLSLRGASAAQTAVRWNGVPMQSGTTGLVDLFSIPVASVDNLSIEYGSGGGRIGSGAMGGVLFITTGGHAFRKEASLSLTAGTGSFGKLFTAVHAAKSNQKFSAVLDVIAQKARNDFQYENSIGSLSRLPNALLRQYSGTLALAYKPGSKDRFFLDIGANDLIRELPPALFEARSVKTQHEYGLRSVLNWTHTAQRFQYGLVLSGFDDVFRYQDSAIALQSLIRSRQAYSNAWGAWTGRGYRIYLSLPFQRNYLVDDAHKSLQRIAVVSSVAISKKRFSAEANGRLEAFNDKKIAIGGINGDVLLIKALKLRASFGNTYRTPTLNELYYTPGGNPDLKPELGWSGEAGYDWKPKSRNTSITFTHNGTAFYRDIHDWILWFGGAIWTPHNIAEVVSKGLETENKLSYRRPKIIYQLSANATVISSKTMQSILPNDGSIGHQIPYAPRIIAQGNAGFNTAVWRFNYNQTFTGDRYFNTDETGLLKAFATGNVQAGWLYKKKTWSADLALTLQNILNARYAEVSGRPAPGRNILLSCNVAYFK